MNPFLFLPPETAHGLTLALLKSGLVPKAPSDPASLQVKILGQTFPNPIGLSAGADKRAEALSGWQALGFGFVEAGTLTLHPRAGNPGPRLWRFPQQRAVVNWLGLPGAGPDVFVRNLKAYTAKNNGMRVGVSLASPEGGEDDFRKLAALTASLADYLALNISCPNTEDDMAGTLASLKGQIAAIRAEAGACPVMVKLGPTGDTESLRPLVLTALEAGAAGFIATNTVPFDKRGLLNGAVPEWPVNAQGQAVGGYSGPALLSLSCEMVACIRSLTGPKVPIIGVGGVQSGADALKLLKAGANLIQLYTGLIYKGPRLLREIKGVLARS